MNARSTAHTRWLACRSFARLPEGSSASCPMLSVRKTSGLRRTKRSTQHAQRCSALTLCALANTQLVRALPECFKQRGTTNRKAVMRRRIDANRLFSNINAHIGRAVSRASRQRKGQITSLLPDRDRQPPSSEELLCCLRGFRGDVQPAARPAYRERARRGDGARFCRCRRRTVGTNDWTYVG